MKNLLFLCIVVALTTMSAVAQSDYNQWETGIYHAKLGQAEMFEKGLAAHNKKYHTADPYKIQVFNLHTGPHSGGYFLALGPVTFSQLSGRPSGAEHDSDWEKNVMPYVASVSENIFWRQDKDFSYRPENASNFAFSRLRNSTIRPGQIDHYKAQIKKVVDVYKAKKYPHGFDVYFRHGISQGPHAITEMNFENWASLDDDISFTKDFDEVHGAGAFTKFIEELGKAVDLSKTFDEIMQYMPNLSSN